MKIQIPNRVNGGQWEVPEITCPHCGKLANFSRIMLGDKGDTVEDFVGDDAFILGHRVCPNSACRGHIFFAHRRENTSRDWEEVTIIYPPAVMDFDTSNIPEKIKEIFQEVLLCHANQCYTASGMMIRKTLEAICEDNNAIGNNLYQRIKDLQSKIVIPTALLDGLDEIRLFGNDAAHIEVKTYNDVGKGEVEAAIKLVKAILQALYQLGDLVNDLQKYKKQSPPTP